MVFAAISIISASESQTPIGISGYKCHGLFRTCHTRFCIEVDPAVANGDSPLNPLSDWKYCNLNSKVKLEAYGCSFDPQLFRQSKRALGFDVCMDEFDGGVYVFEDDSENWVDNLNFQTNKMISATWESVKNGQTSNFCGLPDKYAGKKAITFSGITVRQAITKVFRTILLAFLFYAIIIFIIFIFL
jgi:hypothetical protein